MQYDVNTIDGYLEQAKEDSKYPKFAELREHILRNYPELPEAIEYKMLRYGEGDEALFYLNIQKQHIGFYVGEIAKIQGGEPILKGLNIGKGCVRLRKTTDLEASGVYSFIEKAVELWKAGVDLSC